MMDWCQLIKIYQEMYLIVWFIQRAGSIAVLVTPMETDACNLPTNTTREATKGGKVNS